MIKVVLGFVVTAVTANVAAKPHPVPTTHCAKHSEIYAPACPRLTKGYCKGDFQLCDMG